jgi:hypothetical protein
LTDPSPYPFHKAFEVPLDGTSCEVPDPSPQYPVQLPDDRFDTDSTITFRDEPYPVLELLQLLLLGLLPCTIF